MFSSNLEMSVLKFFISPTNCEKFHFSKIRKGCNILLGDHKNPVFKYFGAFYIKVNLLLWPKNEKL